MTNKTLTMFAVGDIILQTSQPAEPLFDLVAPVLKSGDVVVGQCEVLFTSRAIAPFADLVLYSKPCPPGNMGAFPYAGFNVITLASNHCWDSGAPGIEDTITGLKNYGIAFTGLGMNLDEARRPAVIERGGTKLGFLNYNCVGPQGSWATHEKPGCAYVRTLAAFDPWTPPVGDFRVDYIAEIPSLKTMVDDIQKLRPLCDVLVVSIHKGIPQIPVKLAMYEQQISYAAIDAGADLVLGHHAHILRGIELYKGKTIFHGLGKFVEVVEHKKPAVVDDPAKDELLQGVKKRLGLPIFFERGGKETPFPPPENALTIISKCIIDTGKITRVSYIPCLINKQRQPEILKNDEKGQQVFDYMENITRGASLNARYKWDGDEIVVYSD